MNPNEKCGRRRARRVAANWAGLSLLCLSIVAYGTSSLAAVGDAEKIRVAFDDYKAAILAGDGDAASRRLSRVTIDYYEQIRELALSGSSEIVQSKPLADQLQVLLYRTRVSMAVLETISARELIAHSIEEGWIARDSVARIEAGKVDVRGDEAMLHVRSGGEDKGPAFFYRREATGWRLDLVPVMRATEKPLLNAVRREKMESADFILAVVERAVERELGVEAWIPLTERETEEVEEETQEIAPIGGAG